MMNEPMLPTPRLLTAQNLPGYEYVGWNWYVEKTPAWRAFLAILTALVLIPLIVVGIVVLIALLLVAISVPPVGIMCVKAVCS